MEIIDAQIHRPLPRTPWPEFDAYAGYAGGLLRPVPPSSDVALAVGVELALASMDSVGVDGAIVYSSLDFCQAAISRDESRFTGVLDLNFPDEVGDPDDFVVRLIAQPGMVGVRLSPDAGNQERFSLFMEGQWEGTLKAAAKHNMPVVLYIPYHLSLVAEIAAKHSELRIVIDHCGMPAPNPPPGTLSKRLPDLIALARFPNVAVKLTAAPILAEDHYPFLSLWPNLHRMIDAFRPNRLLWGSDYQRATGTGFQPVRPNPRELDYSQLLDYLLYTNELSDGDKQTILGASTREWFGWANRRQPADPSPPTG